MANVLSEEKKQQVLALGRLGWSLRQIQQATHIRRETASQYLQTVPLLIIDDLGMRKLPLSSAEELLEIIMRRYERPAPC